MKAFIALKRVKYEIDKKQFCQCGISNQDPNIHPVQVMTLITTLVWEPALYSEHRNTQRLTVNFIMV